MPRPLSNARRGFAYTDPSAYAPIAYALAAAVGVLGVVRAVRIFRSGKPLCRGPRRLWSLLLPWRWFLVSGCWYNLQGLPTADKGLTCPECGRVYPAAPSRTQPRRVRHIPAILLLLLAGLALNDWRYFYHSRWSRHLPTDALLTLQDWFAWPRTGTFELEDRLNSGKLTDAQRKRAGRVCVRALGSDATPWNAMWSIVMLNGLGRDALPIVHAALNDPDRQRRQIAAHILRTRARRSLYRGPWPPEPPEPPTPVLIRVSVEALISDALPYDAATGRYTYVDNAFSALWYLLDNYPDARADVKAAIASSDMQQRLLAAAIVGLAGDDALAPEATRVLAEHLGDNAIDGDARLAAAALYSLGPTARLTLVPFFNDADPQRRALARLICKDLDDEPWTDDDRAAWRRVTSIAASVKDLAAAERWQVTDALALP